MKKGYIQVYTGGGKGKSTAAFGLALRAAGHSLNVRIIQFLKNNKSYGEYSVLSKMTKMSQHGSGKFVDPKNPSREDKLSAEEGFELAKKDVASGEYDIVILDEIIVASSLGLVSEEQVISLMKNKAETTELVLTGRGATERMIEEADLVTEMNEVKHYYSSNVKAREGIEF